MSLKYCRENAIQNATQLFWQKGYQGTSMRDIQTTLDMRPGSIYAGFGNKEGLFIEVIDAYVSSTEQQLLKISKTASPLTTFKDFLLLMIKCTGSQQHQQQCLLVRSMSELQSQDIAAKDCVIRGLGKVEKGFVAILQSAQTKAELPQKYNCEKAASWLQQQVMGLRAYSVFAGPKFSHIEAVDNIIDLLQQFSIKESVEQ